MSPKKFYTHAGIITLINAALIISSAADAQPYSPYPATLSAKLVAVRSASTIDVSAETWPGFRRTFIVTLSGIEVPQNNPDVKPCQRELAEKALKFVKVYFADATKIEIHNMTMQTSADQNVQADIYTGQGSLIEALKVQRLARSMDMEQKEPWC